MTISVTDLGHASTAGNTSNPALTGLNVPGGSLIFGFATENNSTTTLGTIGDGTNGYSQLPILNGQTNPASQASYVQGCTALLSGTITYTKHAINQTAALSAFYATGIVASGALDTNVTATASGSGTTPSVTSGTPQQVGELFVAVHSNSGSASTADPNWPAPPDADTGQAVHIFGGNLINPGTGTKTYNPTGNQTRWNAATYGFFAAPAIDNSGTSVFVLP